MQVCFSMGHYTDKACQTFSVAFEGELTNVQFIVMPALCRIEGQDLPPKSCRQMTWQEFAMHVLSGFDLDICRFGIYDNQYISCPGGLDFLRVHFYPEEVNNLKQEGMVWVYGPWAESLGKWQSLSEEEKNDRREDTRARASKYVKRMQCGHFTQFAGPVEVHTMEEYTDLSTLYGVAMKAECKPEH